VSCVCRVSDVQAHGKHRLCRVPNSLPCAAPVAHGKGCVYRVPDIWRTAKLFAHGILPFPVLIETNKIKLQRVLAQIMPAIRFASR